MNKNRKKDDHLFPCPICGNELKESPKPQIRCMWCNQLIIPQFRKHGRQASEYKRYDGNEEA